MTSPAAVSAELVRRQAAETDGRVVAQSRAAEIAREVDRLNRLVSDVSRRGPAILGDPAAFPAVLDAWCDPWPDRAGSP